MIPGIDSRENRMKRFVEGTDRNQSTLFPECLEDWINEENPVRVIDAFVDELDLGKLGFAGIDPEPTGRPSYHPATLLKSTSTVISIAFSRAGGLRAKPGAMLG
jgi:transposase